jgi:TonB dependent receptor/TonB-dependent Receptor Plug Domain
MFVLLAALVAALASPSPLQSAAPVPSAPLSCPTPQSLVSERAHVETTAAVPHETPSPCPSPSSILEIGRITIGGRSANLVGKATAASEGDINQAEISTRPMLRPGELLEQIPGLVISQHSGEGKANQYYLRGFQLDHGTDLSATIDDIPVNLPSHAHGQGYSDINWLIPEVVSDVTYKKGPYYADEGDFSTAGSYDLYYRNTIAPTLSISGGDYGYERLFVADSPTIGTGHLLYAVELGHDNGTFDRPDNYRKVNGLLRWSRTYEDASSLFVTAQAYNGTFNSTDQIPERLVERGIIDRDGAVDPTDGGQTSRFALSADWIHPERNGQFKVSAYSFAQQLNLFSDFTYYYDDATDYYNVTANPVTCNVSYSTCHPGADHVASYTSYCPANVTPTGNAATPGSVIPHAFTYSCADQREQADQRVVSGFNLTRSFIGRRSTTTLGLGLHNDTISGLGLYLTQAQVRFANGTLDDDRVLQRDGNAFVQDNLKVSDRLRIGLGLRADVVTMKVVDYYQAANSGSTASGIISPKFQSAYSLSPKQELYLDAGQSFHTNDARETTQTLDPQTNATVDPSGNPVLKQTPLVRAWGEEVGYRYSDEKWTSTLSLWRLNIASELVFDGDHGVTSPNAPTERKGIEFTNFYKPTKSLTLDLDVATSTARFLTNVDNQGTCVPESLNVVTSAGITLDRRDFTASLRMRYFGPRVLDQLGDAVSPPSNLLNTQLTWKRPAGRKITLDILNLLNAESNDVTYSYGSWVPQDAANPAYANNPSINPLLGGGGVNDYHFHPSEGRLVRLTYSLPM